MSQFYNNFPDENSIFTDSASPPFPLPHVEHGPNAVMHAEPVNVFQLLLGTTTIVDQPTKENQLCLPGGATDTVVAVGGEAPPARELFPNRERGDCLDPTDEEPKTDITSEFDKKMNSGYCVDTPLLVKRVDSLIESGREDLAGIICNLLYPHNLVKGAYGIVASSFFSDAH
jgi:hypothetical protein